MRKGLIFFLGIVTGCVLTIAVLFVIGITNSNANESDITIAEQQTVFTTATKFEVFQVLGDWKSHATLTLLATQDLPTFGYNMIDPLKSWCWGSILFYPFKISRFS